MEAVGAVEPHRTRVALAHGKMDGHTDRCAPCIEQAFAHAPALQARQKVDVKMRGIFLHDPAGHARRMMDQPLHALVRRHGCRDIGVARAKRRPPACLEQVLERGRVSRAEDVAADAFFVLGHEHGIRRERGIRSGIDMAENLRIAIEMRGIAARITGRKTNVVKFIDIARAKGADFNHL